MGVQRRLDLSVLTFVSKSVSATPSEQPKFRSALVCLEEETSWVCLSLTVLTVAQGEVRHLFRLLQVPRRNVRTQNEFSMAFQRRPSDGAWKDPEEATCSRNPRHLSAPKEVEVTPTFARTSAMSAIVVCNHVNCQRTVIYLTLETIDTV